jgi:hypothetical protein
LGHLFPNSMEQRFTEILWPGVGRSALVLSKSGVHEKEGSLKTQRFSASQPACDSGNALYLNTMEQRYKSSARRGALLALVLRKSGVQRERQRRSKFMRPARLSPHAPLRLGRHLISNTMEQRYTEVPPARLGRSLCRVQRMDVNTRKEGRSKILRPGASPAQCAFGHHCAKHDGDSATQKFLWPGVDVRTCAVNRASNAAASLENSCGSARAQPTRALCDWGIIYFKHDGGSATQKFLGGCGRSCRVRQIGRQTRGRKGRSKIHAARRVLNPRAQCDWGIYFQTRWSSATQFLWPGVGRSLHSCAANRASNARKAASLENSCIGACSAHALRWGASFDFKHDGGSATQKSLARRGRSLRSCAVNRTSNERGRKDRSKFMRPARAPARTPTAIGASFISKHDGGSTEIPLARRGALLALVRSNKSRRGRKGRSKIHAARRVSSPHAPPIRRHLFPNTMEQRHEISSRLGRSLQLVCSDKSGVNTRKEGSLENSCGSAPARPLRLGHRFQTRWRQRCYGNPQPDWALLVARVQQIGVQHEEGRVARKFMRPGACSFRMRPCDLSIIVPNTME